MRICVTGMTALVILRALRRAGWVPSSQRVSARDPEAYPRKHWNRRVLQAFIEQVVGCDVCSHLRVIQTCVVRASARLRCKGVTCSVMSNDQAAHGFIDVGGGLFVASPELVFLQMGECMQLPVLMMLGSELTGRFSRDPVYPAHGGASFDLASMTSCNAIRLLLKRRGYVRGRRTVIDALELMPENSWSPMESVLGTMFCLPKDRGGYGMTPIHLNKEVRVGRLGHFRSRAPDILFGESGVGVNFEGEGHFGVQELRKAAREAACNPSVDALMTMEARADDIRRKVVDDKRRDRDLIQSGLLIVTMTKEDLSTIAVLDREVYELHRLVMKRMVGQPEPFDRFVGSPAERALRERTLVTLTRPRNNAL